MFYFPSCFLFVCGPYLSVICPHLSTTTYRLQSILTCCQEQKLPRHSFSHLPPFPPLITLYMLLILLILAYWLFLTDACYINQSTVLVQGKAARSYARSFNLPCLPELRREGGEGGREEGPRRGEERRGREKGGGRGRRESLLHPIHAGLAIGIHIFPSLGKSVQAT